MIDEIIAETENEDTIEMTRLEKNPTTVAIGRIGGVKGCKARASSLSPEIRKEIAKKLPRNAGTKKVEPSTKPLIFAQSSPIARIYTQSTRLNHSKLPLKHMSSCVLAKGGYKMVYKKRENHAWLTRSTRRIILSVP